MFSERSRLFSSRTCQQSSEKMQPRGRYAPFSIMRPSRSPFVYECFLGMKIYRAPLQKTSGSSQETLKSTASASLTRSWMASASSFHGGQGPVNLRMWQQPANTPNTSNHIKHIIHPAKCDAMAKENGPPRLPQAAQPATVSLTTPTDMRSTKR